MQPLSRVKPTASGIAFNSREAMTSRPALAVKVAECIGEWAEIETVLGIILAHLLNANSKAALAMYAALENRSAEIRIIEAAAKSVLTPFHYEVVEAILIGFIRPAMRERDRLAHWCWAFTRDLPDALLLIEPDEKTAFVYSIGDFSKPPNNVSRDRMFVVKDTDLERIRERLMQAHDYAGRITGTLWTQNDAKTRAELLQKLSNEPPIQAALVRLRAKTKSSPATP